MRPGRRGDEASPEGDRDLVDLLDDEPVVVEDDTLGLHPGLGALLQVQKVQVKVKVMQEVVVMMEVEVEEVQVELVVEELLT